MTDEIKNTSENPVNPNMPLTIHAQYIKDMSFENPQAPQSLRGGEGTPQMQVNVNLDSTPLEKKGQYEMVLTINAKATRGDSTLFVAELVYGVVCSVSDQVPDAHIHPLVMIEVPKMAFPFARQILCDAVMGGGYPPLLLNPVDFEALYVSQYKNENKTTAA
jgi:preprotein translocase subunit SecB